MSSNLNNPAAPIPHHTREEVFAWMDAWKPAFEGLQKRYGQLQGGSLAGIVLIVATIGFNFDNIAKLQKVQKGLLVLSLICLILSLGNILNCVRGVDFLEGLLSGTRSRLIFDDIEDFPHAELEQLRDTLMTRMLGMQQYHANSYWCFLLAVTLGVVSFILILIRF